MPGYRGHISVSIGITALFYTVVAIFSLSVGVFHQPEVIIGVSISVLLFGLWPDVDTNSLGQDIFYPIFLVTAIVLLIMNRTFESAVVGIFSMLPTVGKHRGWTHSWWAALLIPSLFLIIIPSLMARQMSLTLWPYAASGTIGYLGHLFADGELSLKKLFNK